MLNRVEIMGRLVRDAELRCTASGTPVASFSLAVESDYKTPNGEKVTDFYDVIAWRNTANFICQHFTKGRMIVVAGRLKTETWTDKNTGKGKKTIRIVAESVYFGDSKKDDGATATQTTTPYSSSAPQGFTEISGVEDDDLPF